MSKILFIFPILLLPLSSEAVPLAGVLQLDSLSCTKTISAFPYSLVKFDTGYPTGEEHLTWGQLGADLSQEQEVVVGEVRVKDYGDKQNQVWFS